MRLLLLIATLAAAPLPAQLASVSGTTRGPDGQPLKKTAVILRPLPAGEAYGAMSDAKGDYIFAGVDPGAYTVTTQRAGFNPGSYPGGTIALAPGQTLTRVDVAMVANSTISGLVIDPAGQPVQNARVSTVAPWFQPGGEIRYVVVRSVTSDEAGKFRLAAVSPGKYYLMAVSQTRPEPGEAWRNTFFPSTRDIASAEPIEIKPGRSAGGKLISLQRGRVFTVRGNAAQYAAPGKSVLLSLRPRDASQPGSVVAGATANAADGAFSFNGIAPGSYKVMASVQGRGTVASRLLEVTDGDVEGVTLDPFVPIALTGRIHMEPLVAGFVVTLTPFGRDSPDGNFSADAQADGSFTLRGLPPSQYRVSVTGSPAKALVTSVKMSGEDLARGIDLTRGPAGTLDIFMDTNNFDLEGVVKTAAGFAAVTCTVTLQPEDLNRFDRFRTAACSPGGKFSLSRVPAGNYRVHAFEAFDLGRQFDPEFQKARQEDGQAIEVTKIQSLTVVLQ